MKFFVFYLLFIFVYHSQELSFFNQKGKKNQIEVDYHFSDLSVQLSWQITTARSLAYWTKKIIAQQKKIQAMAGLRKWHLEIQGNGFNMRYRVNGFEIKKNYQRENRVGYFFFSQASSIQNIWSSETGLLDQEICSYLSLSENKKNITLNIRLYFQDHRTRNDFHTLRLAPLLLTHYQKEILFWLNFLDQ
jgi:hypothetical protein